VISGVPQGSVLGLILFLIFVNDLDCGVINWLLKFADDTKLFGKVQSELDRACLQQDLQRLLDWSREWQMEFNVEKCKVVFYSYSLGNVVKLSDKCVRLIVLSSVVFLFLNCFVAAVP